MSDQSQTSHSAYVPPLGAADAVNYQITSADDLGAGGAKTKFRANLESIRVLRQIEADERWASVSEKRALVLYVGWGGIPQAFRRPDGTVTEGWQSEVETLEALLTPAELDAARRSTQDSHYTPAVVVEAIYKALERFGFSGGKVLEPAAGTGHFIGMCPDYLRPAMRWTAVELDPITARIAGALYPDVKVINRALQEVNVPVASYDLATGNPPFSSTVIHDADHPDLAGFTLHNFMFAKSLKALVPGGLLAMVVSSSLMDKASGVERRWLARRAHLLGAIRLPQDAFKATAGTNVTTDIVFLKKLLPGEQAQPQVWQELDEVADVLGGDPIDINTYFVANPHMMLGSMGRVGSMYRADAPALIGDDTSPLADQLDAAIDCLPEGVAQPAVSRMDKVVLFPPIPDGVPVFGHYMADDGSIWLRQADVLDEAFATVVNVSSRSLSRLTALIHLRTALRCLLSAEQEDAAPVDLANYRVQLNQLYDSFVGSYGFLNSPANVSIFRDDSDAFLVRALEVDYQRINREEAERQGHVLPKGRSTFETCTKAPIMRDRVMHPTITPRAESAADALAVSLNTTAAVNIPLMAELIGKDESAVIDELGDRVYQTPRGNWVTTDVYLSGNVKEALEHARIAAAGNPDYRRNVEALEAVQPADLLPGDIHVGLGAPWVPASVYEAFAREVLALTSISVTLVEALQKFVVSAYGSGPSRLGTAEVTANEVFCKSINRDPITITKPGPEDTRVIDPVATDAARMASELMAEAFADWVWNDADRRESLSRIYNDRFNTDVPRRYDGSFLTFPGKVANSIIELRPTQVNAAWRMIQEGTVLLDHALGAGKTWTAIAAIMESRRMGLIRKALISVPNHLVDQWSCDVLRLYPSAKLLAVTADDFSKERRKLLFARIATADWDIVVIAHSQVTRIEVPSSFLRQYLEEKIAEYQHACDVLKQCRGDGRSVKQAANARDKLKERLKRVLHGLRHDVDTASMEDMGFDCFCLDESQVAKNLPYSTRKRHVSGMGNPAGSLRAEDIFIKVRYLQTRAFRTSVYFLSGTPISNSLAEMQLLQRFLAYDLLKARGLHMFDLWAATFCEESISYELDATGRNIQPKTVLKRFRNVPEMMAIYTSFSDVLTLDDLKTIHQERTGTPWPVPKIMGGKPYNVVSPASDSLLAYIEGDIIPRMLAVSGERGQRPDPKDDNFLKITSDARKAALDMRLVWPDVADDALSKTNVAANNILAIHEAWAAVRGTQLVFCDLSTPKASREVERAHYLELIDKSEAGDELATSMLDKMGEDVRLALSSSFSVYDDLRAKLIAGGVAPHEIAFIHDARTDLQKRQLYAKVNRGEVRILMGSTFKMGAGMNVQSRLVVIHHLDCPWRPSDLSQREGRLIRQGNLFYAQAPDDFEVAIYRYANEKSYDSRLWQLIERKSMIIDQIRRSDNSLRVVDDIIGEAASAAEMKAAASGEPLLMEECELQLTLKRLNNLKRAHTNRMYDADMAIKRLHVNGGIDALYERSVTLAEAAEAHILANPRSPFVIMVGGKSYQKFSDGANRLAASIVDNLSSGYRRRSVALGLYRGAALTLSLLGNGAVVEINAGDIEFGEARVCLDDKGRLSASGMMARIDNVLADCLDWKSKAVSRRLRDQKLLADLQDLAKESFRQEGELEEVRNRLQWVTSELLRKSAAAHDARKVATVLPALSNEGLEELKLAA